MDEEGTAAHLVLPEGVDLRPVDVVYDQAQKRDDQVLDESRDQRVPPSRPDGRGAVIRRKVHVSKVSGPK